MLWMILTVLEIHNLIRHCLLMVELLKLALAYNFFRILRAPLYEAGALSLHPICGVFR